MLSYRLGWWLETKDLLPRNQTGFRKGTSCPDNLITFKLEIEEAFKRNEQVAAIYLDISNAFNDVHCDILLEKLCNDWLFSKISNFC